MMMHNRIYSFILKSAISLLLLTATQHAMAASHKQSNTEAKHDSIPLLRGIAVSADIVGLVQRMVSDYGQYEAALRVNLKDKWFPVAELGLGTADADDPTTKLCYKTSAPYGKLGLDFNIAKNKHDDYRIYAGVRYAMTYYKFDVSSHDINDPIWGDPANYEAKGVKANCHWAELVFGVDAKIVKPLRLGWSFRYRRRLMHDDGNIGNTWYVPGYGRQGSTRLAGTFNVIFEL